MVIRKTELVVDGTGQAKIVDENGKELPQSYAKRFTDKLRQYGINDVTYNSYAPFKGRNPREEDIVQKIVQELALEETQIH